MRIATWICSAAIVLGTGQASATVFDITYTGEVAAFSDPEHKIPTVDVAGLFGQAGGVIGGDSFTATYIYDDTLGFPITDHPSTGGPIRGRFADGTTPVFDSVTLTINGHSVSVDRAFTAQEFGFNGGTSVLSNAESTSEGLVFAFVLNAPPPNPIIPFNGTAGGQFSSFFQVINSDFFFITPATISVDIDPTIVSAGPAVPEPASWTLMVAGIGVLGGALRRRRVAREFRGKGSLFTGPPSP
jgi:hypothetical protein